jgi:hypothetical protein
MHLLQYIFVQQEDSTASLANYKQMGHVKFSSKSIIIYVSMYFDLLNSQIIDCSLINKFKQLNLILINLD